MTDYVPAVSVCEECGRSGPELPSNVELDGYGDDDTLLCDVCAVAENLKDSLTQ